MAKKRKIRKQIKYIYQIKKERKKERKKKRKRKKENKI